MFWKQRFDEVWQRALRNGELTARISASLWAYPGEDDQRQIQQLRRRFTNDKDSLLRFNQVGLNFISFWNFIFTVGKVFYFYALLYIQRSGNNYDVLVHIQIKVYVDGILESRTASTTFDYLRSEPDLGIGSRGMNYFTRERLQTYLSQLQGFRPGGEGFDFLIHTIGDKV